jgi:acyl-CoA synthetase (AMP-forming)/AMP-acid ligase II
MHAPSWLSGNPITLNSRAWRKPKEHPETSETSCNLLARLRDHAAHSKLKPFLVISGGGLIRQYSYGDAWLEARRWAQILRQAGVLRGDRVFIALKHRQEIYFCFLGAMWLGAVPTIIPFPTPKQDPAIYWAEYTTMFAHVEPRAFVTYADNIAPVRAALAGQPCALIDVDVPAVAYAETPPDGDPPLAETGDIALLQFSSGTTGLRKGVMLSHRQIARHMEAYTRAITFEARDTVASWLPLYHDMGLVACFLMPLHAGATVISLDAFEWVARPWTLLEAIETYRASVTWLPNFAFHHIMRTLPEERTFKLGSMRAFINCSEPCKPDTVEQFAATMRAHGVSREQMQVCYGMAETVFAVSQTPLGAAPRILTVDRQLLEASQRIRRVDAADAHGQGFLSCGKIIGDLEVRIAPPDDGLDAPHDRPREDRAGEVEVRGGHLFSGYFRNETASKAAMVDGWYRTGDVGFIHDGELFICGRTKELLIIHGRNYYAHDLEVIASGVEHVKPGRAVAFSLEDASSGSEEAVVLVETELTARASTVHFSAPSRPRSWIAWS